MCNKNLITHKITQQYFLLLLLNSSTKARSEKWSSGILTYLIQLWEFIMPHPNLIIWQLIWSFPLILIFSPNYNHIYQISSLSFTLHNHSSLTIHFFHSSLLWFTRSFVLWLSMIALPFTLKRCSSGKNPCHAVLSFLIRRSTELLIELLLSST
jgi:hypothetical protein